MALFRRSFRQPWQAGNVRRRTRGSKGENVRRVCWLLLATTSLVRAGQAPWWDSFPRMVQVADPDQARRMNASADLCGVADDPTWGLYAQRLRFVRARDRLPRLHQNGIKALTWFEAFGTAGMIYLAQLKRDARGQWIKDERDPTLTRLFCIHWNWGHYDGTGETRWIGVHNYFADEDFARPYTRTHPRYGCPPLTYPDGTVAVGSTGPADDPRYLRVYDAGCAKDVFGRVTFAYGFNAKVNETDPRTGQLRGPTTGLLRIGDKYASLLSPGKDSACPFWIDYARASVRQALDLGVDGLWCDNFSAWDSFSARPLTKAFGEWSVATFRTYLSHHFSRQQLAALGVADVERFDIRAYLRRRYREWGGKAAAATAADLRDPFDAHAARFRDAVWRDPRWLDDPLWRAYLIHKRQTGTHALERYYQTLKQEAAAAGKPDFLVSGNDVPLFSLGWVRGQLDMVSTELAWGWGLSSGARGFMPPPRGTYVPVYKLAREHAKSRFVNVWMYAPPAQRRRPNVTRVLYYQALANHALPMPNPASGRTVGSEAEAAAFFHFVRQAAHTFGERTEIAPLGLYFSTSSQLMTYVPGGILDHNDQPHVFAHWGWGAALTFLHRQYRAVPEWKLTPQTLKKLRLLIIPNSEVFPRKDVPALEAWVHGGGKLIVTGQSGQRGGENDNFKRLDTPSLASLTGDKPGLRHVGKGLVLFVRETPGRDFYLADRRRDAKLPLLANLLREVAGTDSPFVLSELDGVPPSVGLTVYSDPNARRLFVDVNNTALDLTTDTLTPTPPLRFTVTLPSYLRTGSLTASTLAPTGPTPVTLTRRGAARVQLKLPSPPVYVSVILEPSNQ